MIDKVLAGVLECVKTQLQYFTGYESSKKVELDKKMFDDMREWAKSEIERGGIMFANEENGVIKPTRFVCDESLTENATSHAIQMNTENVADEIRKSPENIAIYFHSHPEYIMGITSDFQSPQDKLASAKSTFSSTYIKTNEPVHPGLEGKTILDGIATTKSIGIFNHDFEKGWERLNVEVDGKNVHPTPLYVEVAGNVCKWVSQKMKETYNAIQSMGTEKAPMDPQLGK